MRLDEAVDASGIGSQNRAVGGGEKRGLHFGNAPHAEAAGVAVGFEELGAEDFRQLAGGETARDVHLPEPVLRGDIALDEERIFDRGGRDMRDSERVAHRPGAPPDGHGDRA